MFEKNICVFAHTSYIFCHYIVALDFFVAMIWNISAMNIWLGVKLSLKQSSFKYVNGRELITNSPSCNIVSSM